MNENFSSIRPLLSKFKQANMEDPKTLADRGAEKKLKRYNRTHKQTINNICVEE
jgi:hypothetical protein